MGKINDNFVQRKPLDDEPSTNHIDIIVRIYEDGPLSVIGPLNEKAFMIAALENAIDAVRNHRNPNRPIVVPSQDVKL